MSLAALIPHLLFAGFIGAYFTHSLWFSLAVAALLWWLAGTVALHRNDQVVQIDNVVAALSAVLESASPIDALAAPLQQVFNSSAELIVALNFTTPVSILFGIALGLSAVWAFQLPPLLSIEMWSLRKIDETQSVWFYHFSIPRFLLGAIAAILAGFFLRGHFQLILSANASLAVGLFVLVIGLALMIFSLMQWLRSTQPSHRLNLGYALALLAFTLLPFLYTFFESIRPFQGWLFHIGFIILTCITIFLSIRYYNGIDAERQLALSYDVRYTLHEARPWRQIERWLVLYLPLALIYLVAWIRDEQTQAPVVPGSDETAGDIVQVLLAVALTALLLNACVCACGFVRWHKPDNVTRWQAEFGESVPEPELPTTAAKPQPVVVSQAAVVAQAQPPPDDTSANLYRLKRR